MVLSLSGSLDFKSTTYIGSRTDSCVWWCLLWTPTFKKLKQKAFKFKASYKARTCIKMRRGEQAQRALAAHVEASTHTVAHSLPQLQFHGIWCPLLTSMDTTQACYEGHTLEQNSYTYNKINLKNIKSPKQKPTIHAENMKQTLKRKE